MIMQFLMKIKNIQFYIFSDFNFVFWSEKALGQI